MPGIFEHCTSTHRELQCFQMRGKFSFLDLSNPKPNRNEKSLKCSQFYTKIHCLFNVQIQNPKKGLFYSPYCTMSHQTYSDILCALMVGFLPFMNFLVQQSMMRQEGVDNLSQVFQILKCTHSFFKMVSRTFQKVFTVSRSDFYDLSFYNYSHSLSYTRLLTTELSIMLQLNLLRYTTYKKPSRHVTENIL